METHLTMVLTTLHELLVVVNVLNEGTWRLHEGYMKEKKGQCNENLPFIVM
jgi:hypothetical protein